MKRFAIFFLTILMLVVLAACDEEICQHRDADDNSLCDKCGESYTDGIDVTPEHTHAFGAWEQTVAPTCQAKGEEKRTCSCGEIEKRDVAINESAHTFGVWSEIQVPTCQAKGEETRACACGAEETRETVKDANNHVAWGNWGETTPATCQAKGVDTRTCACGHSETRDSEKDMSNHVAWGEWIETTKPTCQVKGEETRTCACGAEETRDVAKDMSNHVAWGEWIETTKPTCQAKGEETRTCACGAEETRDVAKDMSNHVWSDWKVEISATCKAKGEEVRSCPCGASDRRDVEIDPDAHKFGEWDETKAPTESESGEKRRDCEYCGAFETETIEPLLHDHNRWEPIVLPAVAPKCTETGLTEGKKCSGCGEILVAQTIVAALGHTDAIDAAIAADCTNTGLTEGKHCSRCNAVLVAQEIVPALGHDEVKHDAKAPTCTEIGWDAYVTCKRCNHTTYKTKTALGHTDAIDAAVAADCTNTGLTEGKHCSVCKAVLVAQTVVPALGHTHIPVVTEATCSSAGYTTYTCICGDSYVSDPVGVSKHVAGEAVKENVQAASCTLGGSHDVVLYCKFCHLEMSRIAITENALGHIYDEYVSNNDATCKKDGTKTAVCANGCGSTSTLTDGGSKTSCQPALYSKTTGYGANTYCEFWVKCVFCNTELMRQKVKIIGENIGSSSGGGGSDWASNELLSLVPYPTGATCTYLDLAHTNTYMAGYYGWANAMFTASASVIENYVANVTSGVFAYNITQTSASLQAYNSDGSLLLTVGFVGTNLTVQVNRVTSGGSYGQTGECGHRYDYVYKENTCTQCGFEVVYCKNCGDCFLWDVEPARHWLVSYAGQGYAATCTESGLTSGAKCLECYTILTPQEVIPPLGHKDVNGICEHCGELTEYTATFIANGVVVGTVKFNVNTEKITPPAIPEKPGYVATWSDYKLEAKDVTVVALYTSDNFEITYVLNGGKNNAANPTDYAGGSTIALQAPTLPGAIFGGWFTDSSFIASSAISQITPETHGNLTLYAQWLYYRVESAAGFVIDYSGMVPKLSIRVGATDTTFSFKDKITVSAGCPSWGVYDNEFAQSPYGKKIVPLVEGMNVYYIEVFHPDGENSTQYVVEIYRPRTLTYEYTSLGRVIATGSLVEGSTLPMIADPTEEGYIFSHWSIGGVALSGNYAVNDNVTVVAEYTPITYTITYDLGGGYLTDDNPTTFTILDLPLTLTGARKSYHHLASWQNERGATVAVIDSIGNKKLTAVWAHGSPVEDFSFTVTGGYAYVISYNGPETEVALPQKYNGYFVAMDVGAFINTNITGLEIKHAIPYLPSDALPATLRYIYVASAQSIESGVFTGCDSITVAYVPYAALKYLPAASIVELGITSGGATISQSYLSAFAGIKKLYIAGCDVGINAFRDFDRLETVEIGNGVDYIDDYAFAYCDNLKSVFMFTLSMDEMCDYVFAGSINARIFTAEASAPVDWSSTWAGSAAFVLWNYGGEHGFTEDGFEWVDLMNGDIVLIGYRGGSRNVTLPAEIGGEPVVAVASSLFYGAGRIESVTMPVGITTIHSGAFGAVDKLYYEGTLKDWCAMTLEASVLSSTDLYIDCVRIGGKLEIPADITSIAAYAFAGGSFSEIVLHSDITTVGYNAFANTNALILCGATAKPADWHTNWDSGADNVIWGYSGVRGTTEDGFAWIYSELGYVAIIGYTGSAAELTIPTEIEGYPVTRIMSGAFKNNAALCVVVIPENIIAISKNAFRNCSSLAIYCVADAQPMGWNGEWNSDAYPVLWGYGGAHGTTEDGIKWAYSKLGHVVIIDYVGNVAELVIPAEIEGYPVTEIFSNAFAGHVELSVIFIPDSVTTVGASTFKDCPSLAIYCVANAKPTGWSADWNSESYPVLWGYGDNHGITEDGIKWAYSNLGHVVIIDYVGDVTELVIPAEIEGYPVTEIFSNAFAGHTDLSVVIVPDSIIIVGANSFKDCPSLAIFCAADTKPTGWSTSWNGASYPVLWGYGDNYGITEDGIKWAYSKLGHVVIIDYVGNVAELVIPAEIEGYPVTEIFSNAFAGQTELKTVVVPNSVTAIGANAFGDCSGLENITLPFIGATLNGTSNTHFGYIFGASSYSDNATYVPASLKAVIITGGTSISSYAFRGCTGLTSITIPSSVTSIGKYAFEDCRGLTSITLPFVGAALNGTSDTHFGYIFGASSSSYNDDYVPASLKAVIITGGTSISSYAFYNCTGLTSIVIPSSVTFISFYAFSYCGGLESITVESGNTVYHSEGNCLIETASKTLVLGCKNSVIPTDGSVTSIGSYAFSGCRSLTSITIPDSVTSIGSYAFAGCSSLTSITIPSRVTSIGDHAFYNCTGLTSITIPSSVTSIGTWAFYGCTGLTSITIPDSVTSIGGGAFSGCSGLTSITIPDSVTSIGFEAFSGCSGLTSITIPDSVTSIGNQAFYNCTGLTSVTFETTTGWWRSTSDTATSGTSISASSLANTATAAEYLTSTYCYYYWKRG